MSEKVRSQEEGKNWRTTTRAVTIFLITGAGPAHSLMFAGRVKEIPGIDFTQGMAEAAQK